MYSLGHDSSIHTYGIHIPTSTCLCECMSRIYRKMIYRKLELPISEIRISDIAKSADKWYDSISYRYIILAGIMKMKILPPKLTVDPSFCFRKKTRQSSRCFT